MSLHHAGGWEQWQLCMLGSLWRGGAHDSAILSLMVLQRNCWLLTSGCQDLCWLWHRWRWCYPDKWSVPLHLGWCYQYWCEEDCIPLMEGVGTTSESSSGWWWGRSSWLHQRSSWPCAVGLLPCWWEGRSHQQMAAQWWVPLWFSCVRGDAEGWRDCCLFGNRCRCHLAGLFCLTEQDAEEDGEQCLGQDASLLDAIGDGEAVR